MSGGSHNSPGRIHLIENIRGNGFKTLLADDESEMGVNRHKNGLREQRFGLLVDHREAEDFHVQMV